MNFVTSFSLSTNWKKNNYNTILIIINQLTKIVYYKQVQTTIKVAGLVEIIINMVVRYYGLFKSIVQDLDLLIILKFWFFLCYFFSIQ